MFYNSALSSYTSTKIEDIHIVYANCSVSWKQNRETCLFCARYANVADYDWDFLTDEESDRDTRSEHAVDFRVFFSLSVDQNAVN